MIVGWLAIILLAGLTGTPALANEVASEPSSDNRMQQLLDAMQPGWNLGNTLDADGSETAWGNPEVTQELIAAIKAQGYNSIRIPITWNHRMGPGPDYLISETFMARVQQIVDWSLDAGLIAIIDMHHDSRWMLNMANEREAVLEKFSAAWTQIANHFKDYPDQLVFEGINEPRFSEDWGEDRPIYFEMVHELNTTFHKIVRESGGNNATRALILTTLTGAHSQPRLNALYKTFEKLNDPNLIATVHYYGMYQFSVNMAGYTTFDNRVKQDVIDTFDRVHDTFVAKGIPVLIGEFGLLGFDKYVETIQHGEVLKYLEFVTYYAREKRMTHVLWDNGQHFDRRNLVWNNPDFHAIMMASLTGRSSTAESDSVYVRKGEENKDYTVHLNLNGNNLVEVRYEEKMLVKGRDYELDGEQLTLKAELIQKLMTDELGPAAKLTLVFSAGADWVLHLIHYDTPELEDADWSRSQFAVPVNFNGDRLATMKAVYAKGGNAGPDSWTPYKEFGKSFDPDYQYNLIKLTQDFFKEVEDGEVILTFVFWSGTELEYHLTVEGHKVYGKAPGSGDEGQDAGGSDNGEPVADAPLPPSDPADAGDAENASGGAMMWGWIVIAALAILAGIMVYRNVKG